MTEITAAPPIATPESFAGLTLVIEHPLLFKAALGIGERAYASLRLRDAAYQAWDVAGVAATGAVVASSPVVATTFFASSGFWAAIGLGGVAATPIGWVVAAGVLSGGAWYGITRYLKGLSRDRVTVVPAMISTPMDVLALGLFDLLAPLALKVAAMDGPVGAAERDAIARHFIATWGYSPDFVSEALRFTEARLDGYALKDLARMLAAFQRGNRDCDYRSMSAAILAFLRTLAEADRPAEEREELAIEKVAEIFRAEGRGRVRRMLDRATDWVGRVRGLRSGRAK